MKYTVGKYVIVPEKPFPSMEKAVQYIQGAYPELDKETIEKYLNPKVNDGNNQSNNSVEKDSNGQTENAQNSAAGSKGIASGKDKSGQPSKGKNE
ncbi:hypothetical protein [Chryseobacterium sp.]|uniref:hypothetical protein n=1 Tax=Chryseobacterium sp. TaxID=1871047 RepID=UPI00321AE85D